MATTTVTREPSQNHMWGFHHHNEHPITMVMASSSNDYGDVGAISFHMSFITLILFQNQLIWIEMKIPN